MASSFVYKRKNCCLGTANSHVWKLHVAFAAIEREGESPGLQQRVRASKMAAYSSFLRNEGELSLGCHSVLTRKNAPFTGVVISRWTSLDSFARHHGFLRMPRQWQVSSHMSSFICNFLLDLHHSMPSKAELWNARRACGRRISAAPLRTPTAF